MLCTLIKRKAIVHEPEPGKDTPLEHEASVPPSAPQQSEVPVTKEITNNDNQLLTHLFVKVKDMTYSPPTSDNVAMKLKPLPVKNQKSCTGHQHQSKTHRLPPTSTHE